MKDKDKKIVSSAELQKELNEERKAKGLKEMPAVNPTKGGSTNTYCRMDKSWKSAPDFFKQRIKGRKE